MNELIQLFTVFARIGAVTFGGGYAMLPILQAEVVEKYHWASEEELADYYAVGQCTPGVIAVNTATFIGMKRKGVPGGIIATLGVVFPSLVIITVIAACLSNFAQLQVVKDAFAGIRVCVCVLICHPETGQRSPGGQADHRPVPAGYGHQSVFQSLPCLAGGPGRRSGSPGKESGR